MLHLRAQVIGGSIRKCVQVAIVHLSSILDCLVVAVFDEIGQVRPIGFDLKWDGISATSQDRKRALPMVDKVLCPVSCIVTLLSLVPGSFGYWVLPVLPVHCEKVSTLPNIHSMFVRDPTVRLVSEFDCPEVFGYLFLGFQDGIEGIRPIVEASVKAYDLSVSNISHDSIYLPIIVSLPNFSV
jgi:hypothetical protein